ncbi:MAG TPA: GAF domain-containing protein [Candidatus Saccharimonadia bacterium]|nr:GAF domain-containing protein [Candidatus Saccharimonadia bacterium]
MVLRDDEPDPIRVFLGALPRVVRALDAQLAGCATPLDVAWTLCDFAGRALELEDCVIYITGADGGSLSQYAAWGPKRVAERMFENRIELKFGAGVVGGCALLGAPQLIADTRLDPRYVGDEGGGLSELAVPLRHEGRVLGVIDSEHPALDHYRSHHVRALCAVAEHGARRLAALGVT